MHHHYQSHDTIYVHLQKCPFIYAYYKSEDEIYGVQKCYMVTDVTDNVPDIPDVVMNNFKI